VVSAHEREFDVAFAGAAERPQDRAVPAGGLPVVEPEVEDVPEEIEGGSGGKAVEETDQVELLRGLDRGRVGAQMDVGEEGDDRHGTGR
jgi:hypothetical protein